MSFIDNIRGCFNSDEIPLTAPFIMTFIGDGCYIQCVRCIVSYTDKEVVLAVKKGGIRITGDNLYIKKYCEGDVVLWGKIKMAERID